MLNDKGNYLFFTEMTKKISHQCCDIRINYTDTEGERKLKEEQIIENRIALLKEHLKNMGNQDDIARAKRVIAYQESLIRKPFNEYPTVIKKSA